MLQSHLLEAYLDWQTSFVIKERHFIPFPTLSSKDRHSNFFFTKYFPDRPDPLHPAEVNPP
jgi:hypothetical protein